MPPKAYYTGTEVKVYYNGVYIDTFTSISGGKIYGGFSLEGRIYKKPKSRNNRRKRHKRKLKKRSK